jgi:putative membrane protein
MWGWEYHGGLFSVVLTGLLGIAVIVAILFLIRWLTVSTSHKNRPVRPTDSALEILRQRYAKGEINKEEFEEKKKDLGW